jgi:hypothetical protein
MNFWELFAIIGTAAGPFASILGAWLTYAARRNGEATRSLMDQIRRGTLAVLERMDQRADERHREVIAAIQTLFPFSLRERAGCGRQGGRENAGRSDPALC